jgi:hypothetical protein
VSGWRAGLVALALGSVVLAAGWFFTRDRGPVDPGTTTIPVDRDVTLACPPAYQLACDGLASRLGIARATYRPGATIADGMLVIAPAGDYPEGVNPTPFARSPIAIAVWQERSPALQRGCDIDIRCLIDQAGVSWADLGGPASWGTVALGLADPAEGMADLEAWRLFVEAGVTQSPGFGANVRLRASDEGQLTSDLVLFPSRADAVVTSEVAIASQLENARQRAGRLAVFYPDPTPYVVVAAYGEGRAARNLAEQLNSEELQALLGSLGLRPLAGEAMDLLEGLGSPGGELAAVDVAQRETLVASWQEVVGG